MSKEHWTVTFNIARQKQNEPRHYQQFSLEVNPDEYVLDAIERIWAFHDRSLNYRHACHHSTCGACAMLVNGTEKLTCITTIRSVTQNNGTVKVEPLRNFPVLSDLVVDMSDFYAGIEDTGFSQVAELSQSYLPYEDSPPTNPENEYQERLVDCIECGMCISACPSALTSEAYLGPAILAAAHHASPHSDDTLFDLVDNENGLWRCHSAYECSEVCPSNVDPAWRIMNLRKKVIYHRIKSLIFSKKEKSVK